MILALLTAPYLSNSVRTASSVTLKSRLPTKIFFTQSSRQFESGLIGEETQAGRRCRRSETLSRIRGCYQTRSNYSTGSGVRQIGGRAKRWANEQKRSEEHTSEL